LGNTSRYGVGEVMTAAELGVGLLGLLGAQRDAS
jgi:hypothetical protein